jgi:hypothetical protein
MDIKSFVQSKTFKWVLWGIGIVLVLLLTFMAGRFVGFRQAGFSYRWGENYYRDFMGMGMMGRGPGFPEGLRGQSFLMDHGVSGSVVSVSSSTIVIQGRSGAEQVIVITPQTVINRFRETIAVTDLRVDDGVVVIGSPNDAGQIVARLIRVMPPPPVAPSGTTPSY